MQQKLLLVCCLLLATTVVQAQINYTPYPGNTTYCPGEITRFTASKSTGCGNITWTITNGVILNGATPVSSLVANEVDVRWNDTPSTGVLKITSTCPSSSGGTSTVSFEKSFAIRSLLGRTLQNPRLYAQLPYCSTLPTMLGVDVMFLENTGGATGITQQRADGYEWTLPSGWVSNGSSGTFSTPQEQISIQPTNGCSGGTATVRAYVTCSGQKKYSNPSSISLARITPAISITPQSGYTGASCGNVQPVTFSVTPIGCATNYTWVFPSGWGLTSPVYTATNSITVTPSGGAADAGQVQVTVNLDCGSSLPSSPYSIAFKAPVITAPSPICTDGSAVSISNVAPSVTVTWQPNANLVVTAGQGTANATIKAASTSTTGQGIINATVSCPNTTVAPRYVWAGLPTASALQMGVMFGPAIDKLCWNVELGIGVTNSAAAQEVVTDYIWNFSSWSPYFTAYDPSPVTGQHGIALFRVDATTPSPRLMSVRAQNRCGVSPQYWGTFYAISCGGGGGGGILSLSTYPVPTNDVLTVSLSEPSNSNEAATIKLIDESGKVVYESTSTKTTVDIPVQTHKNGIYYLELSRGTNRDRQRIIIKH